VAETYLGIAPDLARTDPSALYSLFNRTAARLLLVGLVPAVVLIAAGPQLFSFVFGPDWVQAGVYARYLAPGLLVQLVTSPLAATTTILERQGLQLLVDVLRVALVVGTFVLARRLGWSADGAVLALGAALVCVYLFYFAVCWLLVRGVSSRSSATAE
jgi:O-antigen/teichoic acid export membrane protein